MKKENPCKECDDRYIGCHDSCFKYGKWKEQRDEEKKKRQDLYAQEMFLYDVRYKRKKK